MVYLDWGEGRELLLCVGEVRLAARLVQAYECTLNPSRFEDMADLEATLADTADAEATFSTRPRRRR